MQSCPCNIQWRILKRGGNSVYSTIFSITNLVGTFIKCNTQLTLKYATSEYRMVTVLFWPILPENQFDSGGGKDSITSLPQY